MPGILRWTLAALFVLSAGAQPLPSQKPHTARDLRYLGEISDLEPTPGPRSEVWFGRTHVYFTADGRTHIEGRDDAGARWSARLPVVGGAVGWTEAWQADFDRNGRQDLLFAAVYWVNGRCPNYAATLSFLLFNDRGQPVPWIVEIGSAFEDNAQHMPEREGAGQVPAIFTGLDGDGPIRLAVTSCEYVPDCDALNCTELRITGIYEAHQTSWSLVRPPSLDLYTSLVRHRFRHHLRPRSDWFLPPDPAHWSDQGNRLEDDGPTLVQLVAVLKPAPECHGVVHLPPVVNGRLQTEGWKDPCDELGQRRLRLSNGTICYGWPTVVLDGQQGREIVASSENPEPLLKKIIAQHRTVFLAGQTDPKRCSPTLLWAVPAQP